MRTGILLALGLLAVAGGTLLGAGSPQLSALVVAAIVGALIAWLLPLRAVAALLGVLLPIYQIQSLPTVAFDAARYGLAAAVILRAAQTARPEQSRELRRWVAPLLALGALVTLTGAVRHARVDLAVGVTALLSLVTAGLLALRPQLHKPILAGFVTGVTFSALNLLAQYAGAPNLAHPQDAELGLRLSGLGPGSTKVTYELALAVVLLVAGLGSLSDERSRHRVVRLLAVAVCGGAMLASGGRGGVAALGVALVVACWMGHLRAPRLMGGAVLAAAVVWWVQSVGGASQPLTLERLTRSNTISGQGLLELLANGRGSAASNGFSELLHHPFAGTGLADYRLKYSLDPHFFPITLGVMTGVVGFGIGVYLLLRLVRLSFARPNIRPIRLRVLAAAIGGVLLVDGLLEPDGPFVGLELLLILLIATVQQTTPAGYPGDTEVETAPPFATVMM